MKKWSALGAFLSGVLLTVLIFSQLAFKQKAEQNQLWKAPALPGSLSFAGEPLPLERWDVKEKFDKEYLNNFYNQGTIIYLMKLSHRLFPIIAERLKANGVPEDFKYLCIAESNMQSWAVSKSGAVGYWQFLEGTAKGFGLEVSNEVDQRQDLMLSTDAACRYLKQAYAKLGSWTAAAASYNCGMGGYNNQAVFQRTKRYYDLQLPEETNKYIYRIATFKYLLEHADELGYVVKDEEKYQPVETENVTVSQSIPDLAAWAIGRKTNYKMLRNLNPWLKGRSLTVKNGKSYTIVLPAS